jgi:hypothetical protein
VPKALTCLAAALVVAGLGGCLQRGITDNLRSDADPGGSSAATAAD